MTDHIVPPSSETDSDVSPASSLASIPVRRRRKRGNLPVPPEKPSHQPQSAPAQPPAAPRKETFGKARLPAVENPEPLVGATAPTNENLPDSATPATEENQLATLPTEAIIELWESLADEDAIPSLLDLDVAKVAIHWPNSLLLRATGNPRRPEVEVARIFSADPAHTVAPLPIDTMTIDWMMALAREVTHDGVPVHELDNVSDDDPTVEYGVIALPFGSSPDAVDHVLCHFYRYEGAPDAAYPLPEPEERPAGHKPVRRMMASIFGRRKAAAS